MSQLTILLLFGLFSYAMDAVLWGTLGYLIFKMLRGNDKQWWLGASITFVAYFVLVELITNSVIQRIDFSFDQEIMDFIGGSLTNVDIFTVLIDFVVIVAGFKVGNIIVNKTLANTKKSR